MKRPALIRINFASRDYRLLANIYRSTVAGCVALLIALGVITWAAVSDHADSIVLGLRVAELDARVEEMKPVLVEREQFLKDVSTMGGLMESRRFSWTRLLTSIEAAFPTGTAVERVSFNPRDFTLSLEGKARSPEALRNLMVGLEKSASFKDPLLRHQSVDKGTISFAVGAKYHDAKSGGLAQAR